MAACARAPEPPAAAAPAQPIPASPSTPGTPPAPVGSGVIDTADGRYVFTPTVCAIARENGKADIEIEGPGTAPDGGKIRVEFSSTANALTVELGVDGPFASGESALRAGADQGRALQIESHQRSVRVRQLELVADDGSRITGSLQIDC